MPSAEATWSSQWSGGVRRRLGDGEASALAGHATQMTKGCQAQVHWIWNDGTAEAWVLISENVWTRDVGARSVEMPGEMAGRGTRGAEVESGSWHGEMQTTKRTPHQGEPATQTPQTVRENSRTTPRIGPNDSSPRHAAIAQRAQVQKVKLIPPIFGATGLDTQPPHFLAISSIPVHPRHVALLHHITSAAGTPSS